MPEIEEISTFLRQQYKTDEAEALTDYDRTYAASHRSLLAHLLAERHLVVQGDCWYTCAAATEEHDGGETCDENRQGGPCDCGRDDRITQSLRLLVAPYTERADFKDEWRTLSPAERAARRW
ncbi:hypothetical protein AB0E99_22865 [Streptomyces sp. NPDC030592]|uniref:hypothetical protein n=1 Tax=Streptomyces sp. NPDC030592 TaxID=3155365 RepID=UPI0033F14747